MSEATALDLRTDFPPVKPAEWEAQITKDLKGADYDKKLVWKTDEGLSVRPYYTLGSLDERTIPIDTAPGDFPFVRGGLTGWQAVEPGALPAADVDAAQYQDEGATAVEELAFALAAAVEVYAAEQKPLMARFAAGPLFFLEIAKLRAARLLWAQAAEAFGAPEEHRYLRIHSVTARWNKTLYDENNNLLRATVESLAAVVGGCDILTVRPERFDARLAGNIPRLLGEESHLDRVADPAGGSWYVEALTEMLSREAWAKFLDIEAAGGFAEFVKSGQLQAALDAARAAKQKALASRRRVLVGVNNYPNSAETAPNRAQAEDGWHASAVIEQIRLRTERHAQRTGHRPRVMLLELGDVKMRRARATFCENFFGCAGFELASARAVDEQPADLIVLCSSDAEYPALAPTVVAQARVPVIVAGYPKDQVETLKTAGIAGFVHVASNLVDTLIGWQDKLGVQA